MQPMRIHPREFIKYKFVNSFFHGVSVGSVFTIFAPLDPSIYSIGGFFLAIGMMGIAKLYSKILNIQWFYYISLLVEVIPLFMIMSFLIWRYDYAIALGMYLGYQVVFTFGAYLGRAETIFLKKTFVLSALDYQRQVGNLAGMAVSFSFYWLLDLLYGINDNQSKVYYMHYILLFVECMIFYYIFRSFSRRGTIKK
jgi:putative membrane protein